MENPCQAYDPLNRAFEDVALIVGGFLATIPVLDETAWRLAGELCASWFRAASRANASNKTVISDADRLHPSVRAMLGAIRSVSKEEGSNE